MVRGGHVVLNASGDAATRYWVMMLTEAIETLKNAETKKTTSVFSVSSVANVL
jgi:hypothetical protein